MKKRTEFDVQDPDKFVYGKKVGNNEADFATVLNSEAKIRLN